MPGGRSIPQNKRHEAYIADDERGKEVEMVNLGDEEFYSGSEVDSDAQLQELEIDDVPSCCNSKYACDLDYVCSYSTSKTVYIQHFVLGTTNWFFTICIVGITVGFIILVEKAPLHQEYPILNSRLIVDDISNAFDPDTSQLDYCANHADALSNEDAFECFAVDEDLVIYPTTTNLFGIVTRTRATKYTDVPIGRNDPNGDAKFTEPENDFADDNCMVTQCGESYFYTYNVEKVDFILDHSFTIPLFGEWASGNHYNLRGTLNGRKEDGSLGKRTILEWPENEPCKFNLNQLLDAAVDTHEDKMDTKCPYVNRGETSEDDKDDVIRKCGLKLDVAITYRQPRWNIFRLGDFDYQLWVTARGEMEDDDTFALRDGFQSNRTVHLDETEFLLYEYNGIQLRVFASGRIGKLELWQVMLTFMASLIFLSLANQLVDFMMLNCLRERKMYFFMKYEITADVEELFSQQKLLNIPKKQLYIEAAKAQANPQIKEQDNRANNLKMRMKQQFTEEVKQSMKEIREQLDSLKAKNTELVTIQDQTLAAVVQAFDWDGDAESEYSLGMKRDPAGRTIRRFQNVELKSVVSTVVFLPIKDKTHWKAKSKLFARYVRDALAIYEPERVEGRKILTSRGMMIAAQVELGRHMTLEQIDLYNDSPKKEKYMTNFLLVSYKDILWTEMEMIFDEVDPDQHGFVTEDQFRELLHRCSKMGNTKIDYYYSKLRLLNPNVVGVDLNDIADKMFDFADRLETCGCSVILVAVLKEMMKKMQDKRERSLMDKDGFAPPVN